MGGFATEGQHATATLVDAIPHSDMLHRRTVSVFHRMWALRAFCRDAIVRDREVAAVDGDIPTTVQINPVSAGSLFIVVRHFEARLANEHVFAPVQMKIPELRVFERYALDCYPT